MSRELFRDEQSHPVSLLRILTRKYGVDWMEWAPSVLRKTINSDYNVTMSNINVAKALAAGAVATRDEFWTEWETFHFLCQALNNNLPDHEGLQEHTVGQMMVAVDMAHQVRRELKDLSHEPEFSEQVARYIASQALNQGVWYLPSPLEFAAKFAAKKTYRCKDCGNEGEAVFDDGLCDVCVGRYDTERLGDWEPNPHLMKKGYGQNVVLFERNPTDKVKARLEKAIQSPNTTLRENRTDICVTKLLGAVGYLKHRREQLKAQHGE